MQKFRNLILKLAGQSLLKSFLFLGVLLLLITIVTVSPLIISFNRSVKEFSWEAASLLPPITIKDGIISSPVKQPFTLELDEGATVFILDTTGKISKLPQKYKTGILLTKTSLSVKGEEKTTIYHLENWPSFTIDKAFIKFWSRLVFWIGSLILFVVIYISCFVANLIKLFFYSLASLLVNKLSNVNLKYKSLLNIGIYALTVPLVLLIFIGPLKRPWHFIVYHLIYIVALVISILACRQKPETSQAA